MEQYRGFLGVVVLLLFAAAMSADWRRISGRAIAVNLTLQFVLAWLMIGFPQTTQVLNGIAYAVVRLLGFSEEGGRFLFGALVNEKQEWGFVFAAKVLPAIIFFSCLTSVLFHLGIMQRVIGVFAWLFRRSLKLSGVESTVIAANIFLGASEAPLCIRPYIVRMTRSQLMVLMTVGHATIAGTVLGGYVLLLGGDSESDQVLFARHLLTASVLSAPAAVVTAKLMIPESDRELSNVTLDHGSSRVTQNVFDAATVGALDGMRLAASVAAMLVAFVALVAMVNWPLEKLNEIHAIRSWLDSYDMGTLSLQGLIGWILQPLAWLMGIQWDDCATFGSLLGEKIILTEFVAYNSLATMIHGEDPALSHRTAQIATYALCGFGNFACLGLQMGVLSSLAPERRADVCRLAPRAMIAGIMASLLTACVASIFIVEQT